MTLKKLLISSSLISGLLSSIALAGGMESGGGNGVGSTTSQVAEEIISSEWLLRDLITASSLQENGMANPKNVASADARNVLESWLKPGPSGSMLSDDINHSFYNFQDAPCAATGNADNDASTGYALYAPICWSLGRLSRFPVWALPVEVIALEAHERAHHFGFGEREAVAIQAYIYKHFPVLQLQFRLPEIYKSIDNYIFEIKFATRDADKSEKFKLAALDICQKIVSLQQLAPYLEPRLRYAYQNKAWADADLRCRTQLSFDLGAMSTLKADFVLIDQLIASDKIQ